MKLTYYPFIKTINEAFYDLQDVDIEEIDNGDEEGNEDFQSIMKEIGRKDHTIKNGLFQIFDFIFVYLITV